MVGVDADGEVVVEDAGPTLFAERRMASQCLFRWGSEDQSLKLQLCLGSGGLVRAELDSPGVGVDFTCACVCVDTETSIGWVKAGGV